jgi:hypothetical protein
LLNHAIGEKLRSCTLGDLLDTARVRSMRGELKRLNRKKAN